MNAFRTLLVLLFATIAIYTAIVIGEHGLGLFSVFLGDIAEMEWAGQFNVDFMCFLTLSATWLAWRHEFSPLGLALGVCGFFGGALFLSAYLLYLTFATNGRTDEIFLGNDRVRS